MYDRSWLGLGITPIFVLVLARGLALGQGEPRGATPPRPEPIGAAGIENVFRLSPRLYSGGEPRGEAAFRALQALGVKTAISVDGSRPDLETAHRFGIRYVHLPIGYDGIPRDQALRLIRALRTRPGPIFVHCHHGKHRGPAAAAVCEMAEEGWRGDAALAWLGQAGTSADYPGLFASVRAFVPPTPAELSGIDANLPEEAEIPAFVEAMVAVDGHWDRLKAAKAARTGTSTPSPAGPATVADPGALAGLLAEDFAEAARSPEARARGEAFLKALDDARSGASRLAQAWKADLAGSNPERRGDLDTKFATVAKACVTCHARHRDR